VEREIWTEMAFKFMQVLELAISCSTKTLEHLCIVR
jgi:hypothetical protein